MQELKKKNQVVYLNDKSRKLKASKEIVWYHPYSLPLQVELPSAGRLRVRLVISVFIDCHMKDFNATLARKQEWNLQRCGLQWRRTILDTKMLF